MNNQALPNCSLTALIMTSWSHPTDIQRRRLRCTTENRSYSLNLGMASTVSPRTAVNPEAIKMEIVTNCLADPTKWLQIRLPLGKNLSIGTGFERALDHAGRELTKVAKTEKDVTFWIRGDALIVAEPDGLKVLPQGPKLNNFELMARIEGVLEKCFKPNSITGESEWIECRGKEGNAQG